MCWCFVHIRSYNVSNFVEDLKFLYRTAGGEGKGITFIFSDNEIKDEGFLEYINNILSSGEVRIWFSGIVLAKTFASVMTTYFLSLIKW